LFETRSVAERRCRSLRSAATMALPDAGPASVTQILFHGGACPNGLGQGQMKSGAQLVGHAQIHGDLVGELLIGSGWTATCSSATLSQVAIMSASSAEVFGRVISPPQSARPVGCFQPATRLEAPRDALAHNRDSEQRSLCQGSIEVTVGGDAGGKIAVRHWAPKH
jgi:hypothetical protein